MNKLLKKRRARGGFSMVETLVAVLILSIMSSAAVMGMSNALRSRAESMDLANAQTVASTAASAVADQLRYGRIVEVTDSAVTLESSTYGAQVQLCLDGGRLVAKSAGPGGKSYQLLGEKAYSGLAVKELEFEEETDPADSKQLRWIRVKLSVADGEGSVLWSLSFRTAPLNTRMISAPGG